MEPQVNRERCGMKLSVLLRGVLKTLADRGYCKRNINKACVLRENSSSKQAEGAFRSNGYRRRHATVHVILAHK